MVVSVTELLRMDKDVLECNQSVKVATSINTHYSSRVLPVSSSKIEFGGIELL